MRMTTFLKTRSGELINAAFVRRITEHELTVTAYMADSKPMFEFEGSLDQNRLEVVQRALMPVVPAAPGYLLLEYSGPSPFGDSYVTRTPIVAWRCDGEMALPVTPDDQLECNFGRDTSCPYTKAVLCPDGRVVWPRIGVFADEATWLLRVESDCGAEHRRAEAALAAEA
jgi:hypothetical protein